MGDFNADLIEPYAETRSLLDFIDKHCLKVVEQGRDIITATIELLVVEPSKTSFSYRNYKSIHPSMAALAEYD